MTDLHHTIATWIGCLALLVATGLPVLDRFLGVETKPVILITIAGIGVLAVGSRQVTQTAVRLIRAWKGHPQGD